eukprot:scaffold803_cov310-Pinguiococcus_pyrenoidosus.AAC.114
MSQIFRVFLLALVLGLAAAFAPIARSRTFAAPLMALEQDKEKTVEMMKDLVIKGLAEMNNIKEVSASERRERRRGRSFCAPKRGLNCTRSFDVEFSTLRRSAARRRKRSWTSTRSRTKRMRPWSSREVRRAACPASAKRSFWGISAGLNDDFCGRICSSTGPRMRFLMCWRTKCRRSAWAVDGRGRLSGAPEHMVPL